MDITKVFVDLFVMVLSSDQFLSLPCFVSQLEENPMCNCNYFVFVFLISCICICICICIYMQECDFSGECDWLAITGHHNPDSNCKYIYCICVIVFAFVFVFVFVFVRERVSFLENAAGLQSSDTTTLFAAEGKTCAFVSRTILGSPTYQLNS